MKWAIWGASFTESSYVWLPRYASTRSPATTTSRSSRSRAPLHLSKGEGAGVEHVRPRIDSVASKDKEIDIDGVAGAARRVRPTGFSKVGCGAVPVDGNRSHQCGHLLGEDWVGSEVAGRFVTKQEIHHVDWSGGTERDHRELRGVPKGDSFPGVRPFALGAQFGEESAEAGCLNHLVGHVRTASGQKARHRQRLKAFQMLSDATIRHTPRCSGGEGSFGYLYCSRRGVALRLSSERLRQMHAPHCVCVQCLHGFADGESPAWAASTAPGTTESFACGVAHVLQFRFIFFDLLRVYVAHVYTIAIYIVSVRYTATTIRGDSSGIQCAPRIRNVFMAPSVDVKH